MRISNNDIINLITQSYSTKISNAIQNVNLNQDSVTISDSGYQKNQQALFDKVFDRLSGTDKENMIALEDEMEPLLKREENGSITGKEQKKLNSLFYKYDDIIIRNSDKETQRVLFT